MQKIKNLNFTDSLNEAFHQSMDYDKNVIIIGEGVPDCNQIFGTTKNLEEKFGSNRVFDMPLSENALTGICIGAAQKGLRPVLVHQRLDFALLSLDQIINNASKWYYMFDGKVNVPLVIRLIIGRGWGQGPQHSQNLQALFGMINGLKVVCPSNAYQAKGLLIAAIEDENPVIFIEHRWQHNTISKVPSKMYSLPLDKSIVATKGESLTIVASLISSIQARKLVDFFKKELNISIELIDLISLNPIDYKTIIKSLQKTKKFIFLDTANENETIAHKITSYIFCNHPEVLDKPPLILCSKNYPAPTSHYLMLDYYLSDQSVFYKIVEYLEIQIDKKIKNLAKKLIANQPHDIPDKNFKGPF